MMWPFKRKKKITARPAMPEKPICPKIGIPCIEKHCAAWLVLNTMITLDEADPKDPTKRIQRQERRDVGRCSIFHWTPQLLIEVRQELAALKGAKNG